MEVAREQKELHATLSAVHIYPFGQTGVNVLLLVDTELEVEIENALVQTIITPNVMQV